MTSAAKMPSARNSGAPPSSSREAPTRALAAMSYTGTAVVPVRHSASIAATAAAASQDCLLYTLYKRQL